MKVKASSYKIGLLRLMTLRTNAISVMPPRTQYTQRGSFSGMKKYFNTEPISWKKFRRSDCARFKMNSFFAKIQSFPRQTF